MPPIRAKRPASVRRSPAAGESTIFGLFTMASAAEQYVPAGRPSGSDSMISGDEDADQPRGRHPLRCDSVRSWPAHSLQLAVVKMNVPSRASRLRTVGVRTIAPSPSDLYPIVWRFAAERHSIYLRRMAGGENPWTADPVLREYRFTNAFRAADRVSQYLIRMSYEEDEVCAPTVFLRSMLFKLFNKIETWQSIVDKLGPVHAGDFDFDACDRVLTNLRGRRTSIYSGAYIMPSVGPAGVPKHRTHLGLLKSMMADELPQRLAESTSLSSVYEQLLSYRSLGRFLAFQFAIDLNYTRLTNHQEADFVVAGPGALDGLSKCFSSLGSFSAEETIRWMTDRQEEEFSKLGLQFGGLWGRPLQPIDVQNLLCEVSKYTRATHPSIVGAAGRTRIKRRFRSSGDLAPPFFPPKWELNGRVGSWVASNAGSSSGG